MRVWLRVVQSLGRSSPDVLRANLLEPSHGPHSSGAVAKTSLLFVRPRALRNCKEYSSSVLQAMHARNHRMIRFIFPFKHPPSRQEQADDGIHPETVEST